MDGCGYSLELFNSFGYGVVEELRERNRVNRKGEDYKNYEMIERWGRLAKEATIDMVRVTYLLLTADSLRRD